MSENTAPDENKQADKNLLRNRKKKIAFFCLLVGIVLLGLALYYGLRKPPESKTGGALTLENLDVKLATLATAVNGVMEVVVRDEKERSAFVASCAAWALTASIIGSGGYKMFPAIFKWMIGLFS